jgi:hypothetical protein
VQCTHGLRKTCIGAQLCLNGRLVDGAGLQAAFTDALIEPACGIDEIIATRAQREQAHSDIASSDVGRAVVCCCF